MNCPIVLTCDAGYAMPLATTLRSLVEANRNAWPLDVHVLCDNFSEYLRQRVSDSLPKGSLSIRWIEADLEPFQGFRPINHLTAICYARLHIQRFFPDSVSRVLYLDADLLVLDSLMPLWKTPLEGAVLGAVEDKLDQKIKSNEPVLEGVPRVQEYFNSGVLLVDLALWRKEQVSKRALEYLNRNPRSPLGDQDALNVACDGLWMKLDKRWNFQDHATIRIADMSPEEWPSIVHFVTAYKPWMARSISLNADLYDDFRSRTCFARTPWDKLLYKYQERWCRIKRTLRQYVILQTIQRRFGHLRHG